MSIPFGDNLSIFSKEITKNPPEAVLKFPEESFTL